MTMGNRSLTRSLPVAACATLWGAPAWAQDALARSSAKLDSGDTAWVLVSSALVLAMVLPGLALFYGGLVRTKNALGTIMHSFAILCLISVLWVLFGL